MQVTNENDLVKVGTRILVDGWGFCSTSVESCEFPEMAPFRIPSIRHADIALMARVEVTGRTLQRRPYQDGSWIRVKIVFVGDGEPDTNHSGWMLA